MKQKILLLIVFLMFFLFSCGSEQEMESGEEIQNDDINDVSIVEEVDLGLSEDTDGLPQESISEQAEQFVQQLIYYMSKEDCTSLYGPLSDSYKKKLDEQTFMTTCRYWTYGSSFMLRDFVQIDENTFMAHISEYYLDEFGTMLIYYQDDTFTYEYFRNSLEFTDIKTYCTDNLVWDDTELCIERFAKANEDETICTYLGSQTKIDYCKEKVRRLME